MTEKKRMYDGPTDDGLYIVFATITENPKYPLLPWATCFDREYADWLIDFVAEFAEGFINSTDYDMEVPQPVTQMGVAYLAHFSDVPKEVIERLADLAGDSGEIFALADNAKEFADKELTFLNDVDEKSVTVIKKKPIYN